MLSDHGANESFGPTSKARYLSQVLPKQGQLLTDYYATGHGELPNYLALISGQAANPQTAAECTTYSDFVATSPRLDANQQLAGGGCVYPRAAQTLPDQLATLNMTWRGYLEDVEKGPPPAPPTCRHPPLGAADPTQAARPSDGYAARHDPFVYFHTLVDNTAGCAKNVVGLGALPGDLARAAATPSLSVIVPNLCHDGHDGHDTPCADGEPGGLASADAWLAQWVPKITASPAYRKDGMLVVTFDSAPASGPTGDASACCGEKPGPTPPPAQPAPAAPGSGGGRVDAVVLSPFVKAGTRNAMPYNHYSLLRTMEDLFGFGHVGFAASASVKPFGTDVFGNYRPAAGSRGAGSGAGSGSGTHPPNLGGNGSVGT